MTGQAHWLTFAFILGGAVGIVLMGWLEGRASKAGRGKHYLSRDTACRKRGHIYETVFIQDDKTGEIERCVRCGAFPDPERVTCKQFCVDDLNKQLTEEELKHLNTRGAG